MASNNSSAQDPCAQWGSDQWLALVWFLGVLTLGVGFVYTLSNTDYYNYSHNGEYFNLEDTRKNRMAQMGLKSDSVDPRSHRSYEDAVATITK
jgi:hypothetical protein